MTAASASRREFSDGDAALARHRVQQGRALPLLEDGGVAELSDRFVDRARLGGGERLVDAMAARDVN